MPFILKVALPCPLRFCFDYLPDQSEAAWQRGLRVRVPFGSRELVGIVFDIEDIARQGTAIKGEAYNHET